MKNKFTFSLIIIFLVSFAFKPAYAQNETDYPIYIVESGDTLNYIANIFDVTPDEIIQLNNIDNPDSLYPGMSLKIPGLPGIAGVLTPSVLGLGESWQGILIKYQMNEESAIRLNKMLNPTGMYTGTPLLLPLQSDGVEFNAKSIMDGGSTFLEKSVFLNSNPNSLLIKNRKQSQIDFLSNDLIYNDDKNQLTVNSFSSQIETLDISPLPLVQGSTVVIHVKFPQPLVLSGQLAGYPLHFYSENGSDYYALQGIHAMAQTGLTDFSLSATDGVTQLFSFEQGILLSAGNFDEDPNLTVNPDLINPTITQPELERIETLVGVFNPQKYWQGTFISPDRDYGLGMDSEYYQEIISSFGSRRTYNDDPNVTFHTGVDFGGGETLPIVTPAKGRVVFAGELQIRGNATIIDHGLGIYSCYYHQSKILVNIGDMVEAGQKIGEVGNTGRVDRADEYKGAGAHLHWEMWVNGIQVDPLDWVNNQYPE